MKDMEVNCNTHMYDAVNAVSFINLRGLYTISIS